MPTKRPKHTNGGRVSHKERKEEGEPGFGLARRGHGPGCGVNLRAFSIPPSIVLPPSFCRRPQASPRTRAAPGTRAQTHPAGRSGWPRNPSTCSPFHPFRPRPPAPHAPCRPPPSVLCPPPFPPSPLASEKSNGPISPSPARAILPPCATHSHQFRAVRRGLSPVRRPRLRRTLFPPPRPRSTQCLAPTAAVLPHCPWGGPPGLPVPGASGPRQTGLVYAQFPPPRTLVHSPSVLPAVVTAVWPSPPSKENQGKPRKTKPSTVLGAMSGPSFYTSRPPGERDEGAGRTFYTFRTRGRQCTHCVAPTGEVVPLDELPPSRILTLDPMVSPS